jgi:hypothetical protein
MLTLQTFHHCSLHSILNINMYEVEEQWISHQCQDLQNVPTSQTSLSSSQDKVCGGLANLPECHKQTTTLSSCHLGVILNHKSHRHMSHIARNIFVMCHELAGF